MARFAAGWAFATVLMGNLFMVLAPFGIRPAPLVLQQGLCPRIVVEHGVGPNLKTYIRAYDFCRSQP
jgi:hypothetical protein